MSAVRVNRRWPWLACGLLLLAGCTGGSFQYRPMSRVDADALAVGQTAADVRARLGPPHWSYNNRFGENTDHAWAGLVWEYAAAPDPRFEYVDKSLKNRMVFALVDGDTLLNHWELQKVGLPEAK